MADDLPPLDRDRGSTTSAALAKIGGSSYLSLSIGLLRGLLYTRALDPVSRGTVGLVLLVVNYLSYVSLGPYFGLEKSIPILLGEGSRDEAERCQRAGVTAVFALSGLAAALMVLYALLVPGLGLTTRGALVGGACYLVLSQIAGAYRVVLRSHLEFTVVAKSTVLEAVVLFVLVVGGAYLLGAPGTVAGWALGLGVVCLYLLLSCRLPSPSQLDLPTTRRVVRIGLPVLGVALANTFVRTADNIVVVRCLGVKALAYYGLAWQLASYLFNAAGAADAVITPKIYRSHGEGGGERLRRSVMRMTSAFATVMPCLSATGAVVGPLLIRVVLPKYVDAIAPLQVFMFTVVFLALPIALRPVLIAANREPECMLWDFLGGLIIAGLVWALIDRNPQVPLAHLAMAGGVGLCFSALMVTARGLRELGLPAGRIAVYVTTLVLPFAYALGCVWGAYWIGREALHVASPMGQDVVALPLAVVGTAPLVWLAERQTGVISAFRTRPTA